MSVILVNGNLERALKKLKRNWEDSLKYDFKRRDNGYESRGYRQRRKRMLGRARWRTKQRLAREKGEYDGG
jgi:ribosomal protein S21